MSALGRRDGDATAPPENGARRDAANGEGDGGDGGAGARLPVFVFSDETFVIDLTQARSGAVGATARAELVGHLRHLLAEFDVPA